MAQKSEGTEFQMFNKDNSFSSEAEIFDDDDDSSESYSISASDLKGVEMDERDDDISNELKFSKRSKDHGNKVCMIDDLMKFFLPFHITSLL